MKDPVKSHIVFREPKLYGKRGRHYLMLTYGLMPVVLFWIGPVYLFVRLSLPMIFLAVFMMVFRGESLDDKVIDVGQTLVSTLLLGVAATLFLVFPGAFLLVYFLPYQNGNGWLRKHFGQRKGFVVQVRFTPRRYTGLEGFLEDADDVGALHVEDERLVFAGDGADIEILKDDIARVVGTNYGSRMCWLSGNETHLVFRKPIAGISEMAIFTRQALTMPAARRFSRAIEQSIREFIA